MFLFVVMAECEKTVCDFCHQGKEREKDCGTLYIQLEKDGKTAAHKMCMVCSIMRFFLLFVQVRKFEICHRISMHPEMYRLKIGEFFPLLELGKAGRVPTDQGNQGKF